MSSIHCTMKLGIQKVAACVIILEKKNRCIDAVQFSLRSSPIQNFLRIGPGEFVKNDS